MIENERRILFLFGENSTLRSIGGLLRIIMKRLVLLLLVFYSPVLIGSMHAAEQGDSPDEPKNGISERDEIRSLIKQSSYEHRRNADKGLGIGQEAYDSAVRLKDTVLIIRALNVIGANHWMLGQYDLAVYDHNDALNLAKAIRSKRDEGASNNNLGLAYRNLGMTSRAEKCFRIAVRIRIRIQDSAGLSRSLINLGLLLYETARYDSAYVFNSWSLQLARSINDSLLIASNLYYLGRVEMGRGHVEEALRLIQNGLVLFKELDDRNGTSLASSDIARAHLDAGSIDEAEHNAKHALKTAFLLNSRFAIREATEVLTAVYAAKGDYRSAYEYMTMYKAADDSLRNEAAVLRAAQIDIERAIALREKELIYLAKAKALEVEAALHRATDTRNYLVAGSVLLGTLLTMLLFAYRSKQKASDVILEQNVLVEEANTDLSREIETRQRLFSIIGHDLRGPIGNIANMLDFVSNDEQATETEKADMIDAARLSALASHSTLNRTLNS